ncbi:MAG: class I SAM-dependent methyltransferase [Nitrospiria bacterium]
MAMLSHEEMIGLQAEKHDLIRTNDFKTREEYVLHLIHAFPYVQAARFAEHHTVLDFGCNTGYGTAIVSRSAKKIVGVDVSAKAISSAHEQHGHLGIDFQLIDGTRLPFSDHTFDIVISFQVIEHIVDYEQYIRELKRVLSPQGIVLLTTPNALLRLDPGMKPWNRFHVREFEASGFQALLGTFFSTVGIFGLFAPDDLYSVEVNRVRRARENARNKSRRERAAPFRASVSATARATATRMLPASLLATTRAFRHAMASVWNPKSRVPAVEQAFMDEHTLEDLFYRRNDLQSALDLLALCGDNRDRVEDCRQRLKME